ncbi:MAG: cytochrome C [Anaeromyxobacter sp.]|nr:cytochrome C [Anaeromyxobacter sp.]MBL0277419.1 cytochrome C [Anaeromyxobacter sp.]
MPTCPPLARALSLASALALAALAAPPAGAQEVERNACAACHERLQPGIVSDWRLSRHSRALVGCEACHGAAHTSADDVAEAQLPTVDTCQRCHELQAAQFRRGKHARAWTAVKALPTFHHLGQSGPGDLSGCASCHRIGLKTAAEAAELRAAGAHGQASCDACHTRHLFSPLEARQPEACKTCHGTLQYDAWAGSKHGVRHLGKAAGRLPADAAAPTCQTCHMQDGDHANRTPWGNLALRLPLPEDAGWAADQRALFVALGVLDPAGGAGPRAEAVEAAGLVHLDRIDFQNERYRLSQACRQCHGAAFIREALDQRDGLIRRADALCATAVRAVADLYRDGLLAPDGPAPHPDLVRAPAGHPVERQLAEMFFDHRAKLLATAFHMSGDAAGWMAALERDLAAVQRQARQLRAPAPPARKVVPKKPAPTPAPAKR